MVKQKTDLDESRPYGTLYGTGMNHSFEQDGRFFDAQGREVHEDGAPVTTQEKIARKRKELESIEVQKKRLISDEMKKLSDEQDILRAEANEIYVKDSAKKLHLIKDSIENLRTAKDYRDALDLLEYPFDPAATKGDLTKFLETIIDAAA